uniref:Uncharacterized protein n=1 Tax=Ciona intestinalis TaxID=7719 RepID=H2Y0V4_CIOIN
MRKLYFREKNRKFNIYMIQVMTILVCILNPSPHFFEENDVSFFRYYVAL